MKPIRKILVPVEFSETAHGAIDVAAAMARRFEASIDLYHVWQPPPLLPMQLLVLTGGGTPQPADDVAQGIARARLDELAKEAHQDGVRQVRCHVGVGDPAHDICELAARDGFDLIVMATHARGGVSHALLGSVTEKVVRHAPCPVLTVRGHAPSGG
jgi:nucleotide-binding universal stress UspA family protein